MQPRYLYHCTQTNHGPKLEVIRKTPKQPADGEPPVPRLCVASDVVSCFASRLFDARPVYVYRTLKPVKGIMPKGVWDRAVTGERWLIPPMTLTYWASIPTPVVTEVVRPIWLFHRNKRKASVKSRVAQLLIAIEVLGNDWTSKFTREFAQHLANRRNVGNPWKCLQELAKQAPASVG